MEDTLSVRDFPLLCRICLSDNDLTPLSYQISLQNLLTNITGIEIDSQDNLPKNICNVCRRKLEDISGFIDSSKQTNLYLLQDLIEKKEKHDFKQEDEIMIVDDGITIKIEEESEDLDCHDKSITNSSYYVRKYDNLGKSGSKNYTNLFPYICRICLVHNDLKIFAEYENFQELFKNITEIVVTPQDELPKNICQECIQKLHDISIFIELSKFNYAKLKQMLSESVEIGGIKFEEKDSYNVSPKMNFYIADEVNDKKLITVIEESLEGIKTEQVEMKAFDTNTCEECGESFRSRRGLINHLKRGHISKQTQKDEADMWKCEVCNKDFSTSLSKEKHMESHSGNYFLLCLVCGKSFIKKEEYLNHCRIHPVKGKHTPDITSLQIAKTSSFYARFLKINYRLQSEEEWPQRDKKNSRKIWEIKNGRRRNRPFQCKMCHKRFLNKFHLIAHHKIHDEPSFQCGTCSKKFHYKFNLVTHMKSHSDERSYCCKICSKYFKHDSSLKKHFALHRGDKPFQCYICQKKFAAKNTLAVHIRVHSGERPYECSICLKSFKQIGDMRRHHQLHSMKRDFQCFVCLKFYPTKYRLSKHMTIHTSEKEFQCTTCQKSFNCQTHLKRHVNTHISEKAYLCHVCTKTFALKTQLCKHLKIHEAREKTFECEVCQKCFYSLTDLNRHVLIHRKDRPFKCSICSMDFTIKKYLSKHMKFTHTKREKPYQCALCSKRFHLPSTLKYHQLGSHEGHTRFQCEFCSKKFFNKSQMLSHLRVHTSEKPHQCLQCLRRFSHKLSLTNHMRVHTGEKPYQCEECPKRFNRREHVKSHMRIHTGEQPYNCKICSRRFSQRNSLKNHLNIHTGAKPFECPQCPKTFRDNSSMKVHLRLHTGEKPFRCTICSSSFTHSSSLKVHLMRHEGEKRLTCAICARKFLLKRALANHIKNIHVETKKFRCDICAKVFPKEGRLRMHKRMATHEGFSRAQSS